MVGAHLNFHSLLGETLSSIDGGTEVYSLFLCMCLVCGKRIYNSCLCFVVLLCDFVSKRVFDKLGREIAQMCVRLVSIS